MLYALVNSDRAEATPGARGACPSCGVGVLAKCGAIVTWHWAHIGQLDCDPWNEEPNLWHRQWQESVPAALREVTMGCHRADMVSIGGTVIELQHSHLSPAQIREREIYYNRMIWVFDATEAVDEDRLLIRSHGDYASFRWKHPRKSVSTCRRPVLLDLGGGSLLRLKRIHIEAPCGGWGYLMPKADFVAWATNGGDHP